MEFHDIVDKGNTGALLIVKGTVFQSVNSKQILVARLTSSLMIGGIGHFGYKGKYPVVKVKEIPSTEPDKIIEE